MKLRKILVHIFPLPLQWLTEDIDTPPKQT